MLVEQAEYSYRKWSSLLVLILFTTATSILSQRSRGVAREKSYSIATSVFLSELLKLVVGFVLAASRQAAIPTTDSASMPLFSDKEEKQEHDESSLDDEHDPPASPISPSRNALSVYERVHQAWNDIYCASTWMMGVPALIYVVQNMLQLAANSYLSSVEYQGLSQLKLVTAAIISVFVFGKRLSSRQWTCLPLLLLGVVFLTQRSASRQDAADAATLLGKSEPAADSPFSHRHSLPASALMVANAMALAIERANARLAMGAGLVVLACICGSLAGVYIEAKLKASMSVALSVRNAQLASFSLLTAGAAVVLEAISQREWAPLRHFSVLAWGTVLLRGLSGYVVSATLRYADTIMKGFATSVAIITTIALESLLTGQLPSLIQLVGSSLVMLSTYQYILLGTGPESRPLYRLAFFRFSS